MTGKRQCSVAMTSKEIGMPYYITEEEKNRNSDSIFTKDGILSMSSFRMQKTPKPFCIIFKLHLK